MLRSTGKWSKDNAGAALNAFDFSESVKWIQVGLDEYVFRIFPIKHVLNGLFNGVTVTEIKAVLSRVVNSLILNFLNLSIWST